MKQYASRLVALLCGVLLGFGALDSAFARGKGGSVSVKGYVRKDGTYVAPHYRSAPDGSFYNNWSTKGNINPYTGKEGTKSYPSAGYGNNISTPVDGGRPDSNSYPEPAPVKIPANAKLNYFGNGWECERGYYQSSESCLPVNLPKNAKLDYFGHGWECERGFYQKGQDCLPVNVPRNGKLDYFGHSWECDHGYYQQQNTCIEVHIPENGKLDYFGHSWECQRSYYQSGSSCLPVNVPENAKLDYFGHGWECDRGYVQRGGACYPLMSR